MRELWDGVPASPEASGWHWVEDPSGLRPLLWRGDDWPRQPVHYISPFAPGGALDTLSRLYCAKMAELTGQTFLVENRVGSGGIVGTEALAKARPDGYT